MFKYNPSIDLGHIGELHTLDRKLQEGGQPEGIRPHIVELIARLTSGGVAGKMTDPREAMAKRLWDRGFGPDPSVKTKNFKAYLAGIPKIPEGLVAEDSDLQLISLADPRPGLLRSCKLLGIQFEELGYTEDSAEPFNDQFPLPSAPFWFRHDDGRKNRKRRPDHCRDELVGDILAGTAMEGIFAFAHHPTIVVEGEHIIDLPRTVLRVARVRCACLGVWHGRVELGLGGSSGIAVPAFGSLRVRRK